MEMWGFSHYTKDSYYRKAKFFGTYRKILQEQEKNDKIIMLNSFYPVLQVDI